MSATISGRLTLCLVALLAAATVLAQQNADTIVTHGKILTVDQRFTVVEALAITGGRIIARGTSESIEKSR